MKNRCSLIALHTVMFTMSAAGGKVLIHDYLNIDRKYVTTEYRIPPTAYEKGLLELEFSCLDGERGANVAEIWIIKEPKEIF